VDFRLCSPLKSLDDVYGLAWWLKGAWDYMSMGNFPYPSDYLTNGESFLPAYPVRIACDQLNYTNPDETTLNQRMLQASLVFYNITGSLQCVDTSQNVNNATQLEELYWDYLYCTHILIPTGQDGQQDMFWSAPFDLNATVQGCYDRWGITSDPKWISENYGGYNSLKFASNIVFSNGNYDPWSGGGVTRNVGESIISLVVEGGAHHLDLMFSNELDPQSVKNVRNAEKQMITSWIKAKNANS